MAQTFRFTGKTKQHDAYYRPQVAWFASPGFDYLQKGHAVSLDVRRERESLETLLAHDLPERRRQDGVHLLTSCQPKWIKTTKNWWGALFKQINKCARKPSWGPHLTTGSWGPMYLNMTKNTNPSLHNGPKDSGIAYLHPPMGQATNQRRSWKCIPALNLPHHRPGFAVKQLCSLVWTICLACW